MTINSIPYFSDGKFVTRHGGPARRTSGLSCHAPNRPYEPISRDIPFWQYYYPSAIIFYRYQNGFHPYPKPQEALDSTLEAPLVM